MILAEICEANDMVHLYGKENMTGYIGCIKGTPYDIKAIGGRLLLTIGPEGGFTGCIWADKIQRGDR